MKTRVSELINAAFSQARIVQRERLDRWNRLSFTIGGELPQSLLLVSLQNCGELDALLVTLELEACQSTDGEVGRLLMLSEIWVSRLYEICRLMRDRSLVTASKRGDDLLENLSLLRMVLDKHEIAEDRRLKTDVTFYSNGDPSKPYIYSKKDSLRSHIMAVGPSTRGSMTWQAFVSGTQQARWIERRSLGDEFLDLYDVILGSPPAS